MQKIAIPAAKNVNVMNLFVVQVPGGRGDELSAAGAPGPELRHGPHPVPAGHPALGGGDGQGPGPDGGGSDAPAQGLLGRPSASHREDGSWQGYFGPDVSPHRENR